MKTLYLDLFSGISGDMFVGALLDLGADLAALERGLATLGVGGYQLRATRGLRAGISGVKFEVHLEAPAVETASSSAVGNRAPASGPPHASGPEPAPHPEHSHSPARDPVGTHGFGHSHAHADGSRDFAAIRALIEGSGLSSWVKTRATAVFRRIAEAEGQIHHQPPERVHFHEVGAVDSIVDIVGACLALELLGRPRVLASPVIEGTGWVTCAHGRFPVPTPATVAILAARGVSLTQCAEPHELVTPTGAALLAELAESFGPPENFRLERVGYGLGTRELRSRPNALRALLGETAAAASEHDWETDAVAVLETNLDDAPPEILGDAAERLLAAGALEVFFTPVFMKKGRPGALLTVLCAEAEADRFAALMLTHTTALGVRRTRAERRKLRRQFTRVSTPYGEVTAKLGILDGRVTQAAPEYEVCRRLADAAGVPVRAVYEAARAALGGRPSAAPPDAPPPQAPAK